MGWTSDAVFFVRSHLYFLRREEASFGGREDRSRLNQLMRRYPSLVMRRGWLPWRRTYSLTAAGHEVLAAFGHSPHFNWVGVPGVVGVEACEVASA